MHPEHRYGENVESLPNSLPLALVLGDVAIAGIMGINTVNGYSDQGIKGALLWGIGTVGFMVAAAAHGIIRWRHMNPR